MSRRLFEGSALVDGAAMLVGMLFSRFTGVVRRVESVPMSDVGVVRRFLMIAGFMVFGSFAMMSCCVFVVFCRLRVVLCTCMRTHNQSPFLAMTEPANLDRPPCRQRLS